MQNKNDLFVMTKAKDLAKYIITITEKSPKKFRFTLVNAAILLNAIEICFLGYILVDMSIL